MLRVEKVHSAGILGRVCVLVAYKLSSLMATLSVGFHKMGLGLRLGSLGCSEGEWIN